MANILSRASLAWKTLTGVERKYNSLDLWREIYGGRTSKAGKTVTVQTALDVATVMACARVIADGIAQVPLKLFQVSADGKQRTVARDHRSYGTLATMPNEWQTSYRYRETMGLHLVLCGNHFAYKNVVRGAVVELLPFEPGQVTVKRDNRVLTYEVRAESGAVQVFPASAIFHVRGPSWNSWMGLEAVHLARDAIGLSMAIDEQQAGFYARGAQVQGVLSVDGKLTDDQYKKLRGWIDKEHASSENSFRPMILDNAAKWLQTTMNASDAQTLEQRKYQVEEMCRAFRVMPIMVGHSDKAATYASAEQMFLAHVVHTLSPWYTRIEQEIDCYILTDADRKAGIYSKFVEEGLLRGAMKDTADYLQRMTAGGIMTRNEARAKLDMNPLNGLDEPLTPVNMVAGEPPRIAANAGIEDETPKT